MGFQHLTREEHIQISKLGGKRRAQQFTSEYQSATSRAASPEVKARGGKVTAQKIIAEHGREFFAERLAEWRRKRELLGWKKRIADALDEFDVVYEREKRVGRYYIDLAVPDLMIAFEIDETTWHTDHWLKPDAIAQDRKRDAALQSAGWCVVHIPESAVKDGTFKDLIDAALQAVRHATR